MNEHYIRQRGSLQEKEAVERMIVSIKSLPQTMGSEECELIRICFEMNWEIKSSNCGNRKEILKRAFYNYELKKKYYAKKKNQLKVRFQDTFYQYHTYSLFHSFVQLNLDNPR